MRRLKYNFTPLPDRSEFATPIHNNTYCAHLVCYCANTQIISNLNYHDELPSF